MTAAKLALLGGETLGPITPDPHPNFTEKAIQRTTELLSRGETVGLNKNNSAIAEAEAYDGPSLIIAYAHCINHGINMALGLEQQKKAVACGHWPLYRFNPDLEAQGKNPLIIDSKTEPTISFEEYALGENRYRTLKRVNADKADSLLAESQKDVLKSLKFLTSLAAALEPEAKVEE